MSGKKIDANNSHADHNIPWSWGTKRGGKTTYDNLVVLHEDVNQDKSDMSLEQYINYLKNKKVA